MNRGFQYPAWVAYEPGLVPPPELMAWEGIDVLEEWFRWGEEWCVMLRAFARLGRETPVLEIGCGLGRIAFPMRFVLGRNVTYDGFDIVRRKIDYLQNTFQAAHPNFRFTHADVHNTHYNPNGKLAAGTYRFPYPDQSFDVVFAASVFTHMAPENTAHYFREASRVLKPGGRCLFSFFLLDYYRVGAPRAHGFHLPDFNFDHPVGTDGGCATAFPHDLERMTAYRADAIERMAAAAGLRMGMAPLPGYWSGEPNWIGAQDLVLLVK